MLDKVEWCIKMGVCLVDIQQTSLARAARGGRARLVED